jgi:hypothetical protein
MPLWHHHENAAKRVSKALLVSQLYPRHSAERSEKTGVWGRIPQEVRCREPGSGEATPQEETYEAPKPYQIPGERHSEGSLLGPEDI